MTKKTRTLGPNTADVLQREVGKWSRDNFGDQDMVRPLLGVIEELGELDAACEAEDEGELLDAAGDVCIYMADFCSRAPGFSLCMISGMRVTGRHQNLHGLMSSIAHNGLKFAQDIRGDKAGRLKENLAEALRFTLTVLEEFCGEIEKEPPSDLSAIATSTWKNVVSKRNWKKAPETGIAPEPLPAVLDHPVEPKPALPASVEDLREQERRAQQHAQPKPTQGVKPEWLWREHRMWDLMQALIDRHHSESRWSTVSLGWLCEMRLLAKKVQHHAEEHESDRVGRHEQELLPQV